MVMLIGFIFSSTTLETESDCQEPARVAQAAGQAQAARAPTPGKPLLHPHPDSTPARVKAHSQPPSTCWQPCVVAVRMQRHQPEQPCRRPFGEPRDRESAEETAPALLSRAREIAGTKLDRRFGLV